MIRVSRSAYHCEVAGRNLSALSLVRIRPDRMHLLVTRPQPEAERTAASLRERGHTVTLAPLLAFAPLDAAIGTGPWAGVLLTSASAVRALRSHPALAALRALPAIGVGDRTATAAREAGFTDVASAAGDARDLVAAATRRFAGVGGTVLYLSGEDRAADVGAALAGAGVRVTTTPVYRMISAERFSPPAADALRAERIQGVLHYSRRSALAYLACAGNDGLAAAALQPVHYVLSAAVAAPLLQAGANDVRAAAWPDEARLLETVGSV
jgi:uroporphyrinogen-III synthase